MSAHGFFLGFKNLIKGEKVSIDNEIFRLHYRGTTALLVICSALLTAKQFFGDPIACHVRGDGAIQGLVTTYCWIHGTYTLRAREESWDMDRREYTPKELNYMRTHGYNNHRRVEAHPGFGTFQEGKHEKVYHTYYQWVCLILWLQALLFYFPRYCWKKVEDGKIRLCTPNMKDPEFEQEAREKHVKRLLNAYKRFKNKNNFYAMAFFGFEMLNGFNSVVQLFLIDKFMGKRFMDYGLRIWNFYSLEGEEFENQVDPMHEVFPKMAKCDFYQHSTSGQIDGSDAMCLLPLNIVNEKIFLVLWLWLIILIPLSLAALLYRAMMMMCPNMRGCMIWKTGNRWEDVADACSKGEFGDWFLLRQMSKNVDPEIFGEFLKQLCKNEGVDYNYNQTSSSQSRAWQDAIKTTLKKRLSAAPPDLESQAHPGSSSTLEETGSLTGRSTMIQDQGQAP